MDNENESKIIDFFEDQTVLITGGSGFIGKVLIEKLLRICCGIKKIYILLRVKNNVNSGTRLVLEILKSKVFDTIRKESPNLFDKLFAIEGDITRPDLGLAKNHLNSIINEVSVIFHCAGSSKFDETLKNAVNCNVLGTKRLLDISRQMKQLVAFLYVSTAYSNCNNSVIDEIVNSSPVSPQKLIDLIEWLDEQVVNDITPKVLGQRPNSSTYTKAVTESLLMAEYGYLPIAIIRPSIVTAILKEPIVGWVDSYNGANGLISALNRKVLRVSLYDPKLTADLIPVDIVVNMMTAIVWFTATRRLKNILVYNCVSGVHNQINWSEVERNAISAKTTNKSYNIYKSYINKDIHWLFKQTVPAVIVDVLLKLCFKKQKMIKLNKRLHKQLNEMEYFTTHEWKFTNNNVSMLLDEICDRDKELFNFDIRTIDWKTYFNIKVNK